MESKTLPTAMLSPALKPITIAGCFLCKELKRSTDFCMGNPGKYPVCKTCEAARQRTRKSTSLKDGQPHCAKCDVFLTAGKTIKGMTFFKCGCGCKYRYRSRKAGGWYAGKVQCVWCHCYGCTSHRHIGSDVHIYSDSD